MDQKVEETFIVTRFINPSYFMLFDPTKRDDIKRRIDEESLEAEIVAYNNHSVKKIEKNNIVAYYSQDLKRYIRCEVDDVKEFNNGIIHYFLYALDYGVSFYTTRDRDMYPVSILFKFNHTPIIHKVALSVLPARSRFNFLEDKEETYFHHIWSEAAIKMFQKSMYGAAVITFEPSADLPNFKGFIFGDLKITTFYGLTFSLCEELVRAKVATRPSSTIVFQKQFMKLLDRDIERWNDNMKLGGVLKEPEGKVECYIDEILAKKYVVNCEAVKCRVSSVQKVVEWQERNSGYQADPIENENEEGTSNIPKVDEGFDEHIVRSDKKVFVVPIESMQNLAQ